MNVTLAHIGARFTAKDPFQTLTAQYLERCSILLRCENQAFKTEDAFFTWLDRQNGRGPHGQVHVRGAGGRTPAVPVLLDSRGRAMTSEFFAAWLAAHRQDGFQHIVFAIGPASGWSPAALPRAKVLLSLGSFTLAHALARLVLAEQLYRACTILTGHPYHTGH
jgi:23S rRNA (pseudouridine1915-N3)-methyltransferase